MAVGIENARLHTRTTRQARTLVLLNEIARELTSILNLDELLKRIAELLSRLIDYQMFSILLLDATGEKLQHRFSQRFQENMQLKHDIPLGEGWWVMPRSTGKRCWCPTSAKIRATSC